MEENFFLTFIVLSMCRECIAKKNDFKETRWKFSFNN